MRLVVEQRPSLPQPVNLWRRALVTGGSAAVTVFCVVQAAGDGAQNLPAPHVRAILRA